jgi:2',3'-cyclic-nucleotide 2'-phosphodiesterase (5'-nucleotidase family)
MQVTNVNRQIKFSCLSFVLLMLGACSSSRKSAEAVANWPAENPFEDAESIQLPSVKATHPSQFRIYFSGNVNGETEPCGCAINPKGGLDRRLNFIRQSTRESLFPHVILDAGNVLFASERLDKSQAELQKQRAQLLLKGNRLMKVVAQNVGYLDLTAGVDFLKSSAAKEGVPLLSANWVDAQGKLIFAPQMTFDLGREKVLIVGLSKGFKSESAGEEGVKVLDPFTTLEKILATAPAEQVVILLSDLGTDEDQKIALKVNRPLIIVGSRDLSSLEIPLHVGASIILQGQLQGQQWGSIDVAWKPHAKAWYNVDIAKKFRDLWVRRGTEWNHLASREASDERTQELNLLLDAQKDMLRFTPAQLAEKSVYEYRLVDMSVEFGKTNEVTPLMAKVKKPK